MAIYKIYMRSFAPWREFGAFTNPSRVQVPLPPRAPAIPYPRVAAVTFGGSYHGDGRGFSLDTGSGITARINAYLEVDLSNGTAVAQRAWCDQTRGPWMGIGPSAQATGTVDPTFSVTRSGPSVTAVIEYDASNPLVAGAPDIDAMGEFTFTVGSGILTIDATITGDQFPACESFIQDPLGTKIFVGGFAPANKGQLMRLFGGMNKPQEVWFETHVVIQTDADGSFRDLQGGGSGSNLTGPACENVTMNVKAWNVRIMGSIPMPADAP
jgi:hypothetical protein